MNSIRDATDADEILQQVLKRMKQNDWEKHKKTPEIMPYYLIRHELSRVKGLILGDKQIVIPERPQKQVIRV